jgi:GxxExxY protein
MENDPLTEKVIGLAIEVHRNLGPGLLESVYEECLCKELADAGIDFQRQKSIPVVYKDAPMETGFRADIVVGKELLIEVKAVERMLPVHEAQILTYLKFSGFSKGLLVNFNTKLLKDGIKRFVAARKTSAISPVGS